MKLSFGLMTVLDFKEAQDIEIKMSDSNISAFFMSSL